MSDSPLLRVCGLLNAGRAQYLIVGARAAILHGLDRTTEDVDILIPEDVEITPASSPLFRSSKTTPRRNSRRRTSSKTSSSKSRMKWRSMSAHAPGK